MEELRRYPAWVELYERIKSWDYGSLHTHDEIQVIVGIPKQTALYYTAVGKANDLLIQRKQKCLTNQLNVGYEVAESRDHIKISRRHIRRANKQLKRSFIISTNTNFERLTDEELKITNKFIEKQMRFLAIASEHDEQTARLTGDSRLAFTKKGRRLKGELSGPDDQGETGKD